MSTRKVEKSKLSEAAYYNQAKVSYYMATYVGSIGYISNSMKRSGITIQNSANLEIGKAHNKLIRDTLKY